MTKTHDDYTIAWVCALPLEAAAAKAMLDKLHPPLQQPPGDDNAYELGEVSGHNIVVICLPAGLYGTTSAATVVAQMRSLFRSLRFALLVGIGGGAPSRKHDIRLGDVVVSQPTNTYGGVVQYDYGKTINGGFHRTGIMSPPPQVLLTAMARLQTSEIEGYNPKMGIVSDLLNINNQIDIRFRQPSSWQDQLFHSTYNHPKGKETCISCDKRYLIQRTPRFPDGIRIHYGIIASANQVMKDGDIRDQLSQEYGFLCFEMEAAGIMNQIPSLVIRGICDYSDSHKNKHWQGYAALTAAAYSKVLLSVVPVNQFRPDNLFRSASWMVPFPRNPRFLGRQDHIQQLQRAVFNKDGARQIAIAGLGGTGKTQIALELAYAVRTAKPEYSIFWVPAMSSESIEQAYSGISERLGLQGVSQTDIKPRVKTYLSSEKAGPWVLIIDNADDIAIWRSSTNTSSGISSGLKSFLPQNDRGFILFTTRNRQLANLLVGPDVISVTQMDNETAANLLHMSLNQKDRIRRDQISTDLLHQLSGLPLAIVQAASYINETGISLESYLDLLHKQEDTLIELLSQNFEDNWRYDNISNAVAATWLISFQQIQRSNLLAAEYLSFMACVYPRSIPRSLLPPESSIIQQQKALGLLKAYSFITGDDHDRFFHLHRLVHLASRNWLKIECQFIRWVNHAAKRLSEVFPSSAHEHRALWREYMPHAQFVLQSQEFGLDGQDQGNFIQNVAECLNSDGKYREAGVLFQKILQEKSILLPEDHQDILSSKAWVALTFRNQGRWTEAEQLFTQVIETRNKVLGPEHPSTLASMANLAAIFRNQGRWTEAEQLYMQVIETRKKVLGPEHPSTLASMANLAATFRHQGRWGEAEQLFVQVIKIRKTVLGPKHPSTLASMANLAATFRSQGQWKEAEQLFVQVIDTRKTVLGSEHPSTLASMANLALTFLNQGRLTKAEQLFVQVIKTRKMLLGPEHPDTLTSMNNLSHTLRGLGRHSEAVSMLETCVGLLQKRLGASHPATASAVKTLRGWQAKEVSIDLLPLQVEESDSDHSPGPVDATISGAHPADTLLPPEPILPKSNTFFKFCRVFFKKKS